MSAAERAGDMGARQLMPPVELRRLSSESRTCIERLLQYETPATIESVPEFIFGPNLAEHQLWPGQASSCTRRAI